MNADNIYLFCGLVPVRNFLKFGKPADVEWSVEVDEMSWYSDSSFDVDEGVTGRLLRKRFLKLLEPMAGRRCARTKFLFGELP